MNECAFGDKMIYFLTVSNQFQVWVVSKKIFAKGFNKKCSCYLPSYIFIFLIEGILLHKKSYIGTHFMKTMIVERKRVKGVTRLKMVKIINFLFFAQKVSSGSGALRPQFLGG